MFLEGSYALSWFPHKECPGPIPADQTLIRPFRIPIPGIRLQDSAELPEPALHVTKSWVHLVGGEADARIDTETCGNVVVLRKFPR